MIIELTFLIGFTMSIDAQQLYGVSTYKECTRIVESVVEDFAADAGFCYNGNILKQPSSA